MDNALDETIARVYFLYPTPTPPYPFKKSARHGGITVPRCITSGSTEQLRRTSKLFSQISFEMLDGDICKEGCGGTHRKQETFWLFACNAARILIWWFGNPHRVLLPCWGVAVGGGLFTIIATGRLLTGDSLVQTLQSWSRRLMPFRVQWVTWGPPWGPGR